MEGPPIEETTPDNLQERELSFEEQVALATTLFQAVDDRNVFIQRQGGFDTFAEVGQHVNDMRSVYDKMEEKVSVARQEFDEKVVDKNAFVSQLRSVGNDALAGVIASMFGVSRGNIFSRFFKKK